MACLLMAMVVEPFGLAVAYDLRKRPSWKAGMVTANLVVV